MMMIEGLEASGFRVAGEAFYCPEGSDSIVTLGAEDAALIHGTVIDRSATVQMWVAYHVNHAQLRLPV